MTDKTKDGVGGEPQIFRGEWDDEGVYVYQAYNDDIANWALENQTFKGCPQFRPIRMTWFKPSFGWVLYRSGYGRKPNQTRILKLKLSHETMANILTDCDCHGAGGHGHVKRKSKELICHHDVSNDDSDNKSPPNGNTTNFVQQQGFGRGCVQWDPERDVMMSDPKNRKEPRKMLKQRAIQIGVAGSMSLYFVDNVISIQDVTCLAHDVERAHRNTRNESRQKAAMEDLLHRLPVERPYMPYCSKDVLSRLGLIAGPSADEIAKIGMGKAI